MRDVYFENQCSENISLGKFSEWLTARDPSLWQLGSPDYS